MIRRAANGSLTVRAKPKADGDEKSEDNIRRLATPSDDVMQVWKFVAMRDYQGK